ncbi:unnamed protein product, partial [marine sediment metagenome]
MKTHKWELPEKIKTVEMKKAGEEYKGETLKEDRVIKDEKKNPFTGSIIIEVPKYTQRLQYLKECNFKTNKAGEVDQSGGTYDSIIKMIDIAKKHMTKVEVMRVEDGLLFESIEDLEYDKEGS